MAKNDDEILDEFTRCRDVDDGIAIEIEMIQWPHPHAPASKWITATRLTAGTPKGEVERTQRTLLQRRGLFGLCRECEERKLRGAMLGDDLCQACAEKNHGVVL